LEWDLAHSIENLLFGEPGWRLIETQLTLLPFQGNLFDGAFGGKNFNFMAWSWFKPLPKSNRTKILPEEQADYWSQLVEMINLSQE
jgi:hypothetical protein